MNYRVWTLGAAALLLSSLAARAEIKITINHNSNDGATPAFKFKEVPAPAKTDAATKAKVAVVDGERDPRGAELDVIVDGKLPSGEDEPSANFYFDEETPGGRFSLDLGSAISMKQINTYSWHPSTRGPQVYKLYASDGAGTNFIARPKNGTDPEKCGWKLIAKVDTRPKTSDEGGQYGVSISDSAGPIGSYRYVLFDVARTEDTDAWGNTFYSEIDVIAMDGTASASSTTDEPYVVRTADGSCEITIDTQGAPDLTEWARTKLTPVLVEWYPKLTAMLPSEAYAPPNRFSVRIAPGNGVAATSGTRVTANSAWIKNEVNREGIGALLHEEVHVVQQYGNARRTNPNARSTPGWITEGIPDYIRWFLYEPQSHGADDVWMKRQNFSRVRYDGSYRITANFLNYVVEKYDKNLITRLNAAARTGTYSEDIWKSSGKTLDELGTEWKADLAKKLGVTEPAATNNPVRVGQ